MNLVQALSGLSAEPQAAASATKKKVHVIYYMPNCATYIGPDRGYSHRFDVAIPKA